MHEMSLIQSMWDIIQTEIKDRNVTRVKEVNLMVGDYLQVVDDILITYFEAFTLDFPVLADARLIITHEAAQVQCRRCSGTWDFQEHQYFCPVCSTADCEILSGRDIRIVSLEVENEN